MQYENSHVTLFEVSWEVCNKVGGIYSVVSSKILEAIDAFGEDYYLIGPDLKNNAEFEETDEPCWDGIKTALAVRNIKCRLGRWNIAGRPKVILVSFNNRYNQDQLLFELWNKFSVDSLSGGWDYIEPVMFSTLCGEVISAIYNTQVAPFYGKAVAHFHEWMCGAGLLATKRLSPEIATVFTTHATMLGRSMAGSGVDIYRQMKQIAPVQEAASHNITAKCSMESVSAKEADCFTTVSGITADEATAFLGRTPDVLTLNGLDMRVIKDYSKDRTVADEFRAKLMAKANTFLRKKLPDDTKICVISGRYEFHNKGIDLFLDALAQVDKALKKTDKHILVLCTVMGGHTGVDKDAISGENVPSTQGAGWISTHHVYDQEHDPIIASCNRHGLTNQADNNVNIIFTPAMLDGKDGFFDLEYYELLTGSDLGVFPSWYEPWGYTPEESIAHSVPTITTDLSGFGMWARDIMSQTGKSGVGIVARRQNSYEYSLNELRDLILKFTSLTDDELSNQRVAAYDLAMECCWQKFFPHYIEAYQHAINRSLERGANRSGERRKEALTRVLAGSNSSALNLHLVTAVAELPPNLIRLRELANNLWWCWQPGAWKLFSQLNPSVWAETDHNPIRVIEEADPEILRQLASSDEYLALYKEVMEDFDNYMAEPVKSYGSDLSMEKPIAYFSTEYGLHESLTIYSGGLGVLSGDHLKSASDLNIPLIGVGLLYRNGYFRQRLDHEGVQIPIYPENDFNDLPLERVQEEDGTPVFIELDLPGRQLFVQIWKVKVGRISLYLLDTDVPFNTPDDRKITARLYEADRDYRLRQEILLGMGGVKALRRLGITPSSYHMNEGHSAFMVLERIQTAMNEKGLSFSESLELIKSNTIFTTHTPVDAGNERFNGDLIEKYFSSYASSIGLSFNEFMRLGKVKGDERNVFEMTVLALNSAFKANGVSRLHGVVSRHMWKTVWKGVPVCEVPIDHITNGIHVPSYVGSPVRDILTRTLGKNWLSLTPEAKEWNLVDNILAADLWNAKQQQKVSLLKYIENHLPDYFQKFGIPRSNQKEILGRLSPQALIIGFARRFAPYKRATLLFADPERLARILGNSERPVIFVFSGKAHPADTEGIKLIQQLMAYCKDPRFLGKIFFIEDYTLAVSRMLVQGCDVWLNTPRRPYEASGTSGQKVPVNGGLNLSISDGWWCEGQGEKNGWTIGPMLSDTLPPQNQNDYADAESLYSLLEENVVPLYYDRPSTYAVPEKWVEYSKNSIKTLTAQFSSDRMVSDYLHKFYIPAAQNYSEKMADKMSMIKSLAAWNAEIASRFASVKVGDIRVDGIDGDSLTCGLPLGVQIDINLGSMATKELLVQLVIGPATPAGDDFAGYPEVVRLTPSRMKAGDDGVITFKGTYVANRNGRYVYGFRVLPITEGLESPISTGLVIWA